MTTKKKTIVVSTTLLACVATYFGARQFQVTQVIQNAATQSEPPTAVASNKTPYVAPYVKEHEINGIVFDDQPLVMAGQLKLDLALDRVYVRGAGQGKCFQKFTPAKNRDELFQRAREIAVESGKEVQMVTYMHGQPRLDATMRTISDEVLVKTQDREKVKAIATDLGLKFSHVSPAVADYLVFRSKDGNPLTAASAMNSLQGAEGVLLADMDYGMKIQRMAEVNDPLYKYQWHLKNTGQDTGIPGVDANVEPAWDLALGSGIVIGINDDGMQLAHPDLAPNLADFHIDMSKSDLIFNADGTLAPASVVVEDTTPADNEDDNHGTSVGGVAAARGNNGIGVSGSAPFAKLSAVRFLNIVNDDVTDTQEIALTSRFRDVDTHIKNNSWGSDTIAWFSYANLIMDALRVSGTTGRGGKGSVHVYAAGNSREDGNQCIKSGMLNSPYVIPVAAMNNRGGHSSYSDFGPMIVVAGPSSSVDANGIVTTDRTGVRGYNTLDLPGEATDNNYTKFFGGTSSATPLVSGVIALMLEVNPNLTTRDIKEILLRSSTLGDLDPRGWVFRDGFRPDLAPIKHHNDYGGGRVDAFAAVIMARDWLALPETVTEISKTRAYAPATNLNQSFVTATFDLSTDPQLRVEHVYVDFPNAGLVYEQLTDLSLILTAPDGTESILHTSDPSYAGELVDNDLAVVPEGFMFTSVRHWGSTSRGTWKVRIAEDVYNYVIRQPGDVVDSLTAVLSNVRLRVEGTALPTTLTRTIKIEGPADFDFGAQDVGNEHIRSFSITNEGGQDFVVTGVDFTGDPVFSGDFNGVVPAGATRNFDVKFNPEDAVNYTGILSVRGSATSGLAYVTIKGSGQAVPAPVVTAVGDMTFRTSSDIILPVTANHAVTFIAKGLPKGMVIDPVTGVISGKSTVPGTYDVTVTAVNPWGTSEPSNFTIVIEPIATNLQGSYTAVIDKAADLNLNMGGMVRLNLTQNGSYSGVVAYGKERYSIKGFVGGSSTASPRLEALLIPKSKLSFKVILDFNADQTITGSLFNGQLITSDSTPINGWRNSWSAAANYPNPGNFNHQISVGAAHAGVVSIPQGHGFATQTVDVKGLTRVKGTTADGQTFTCSYDVGFAHQYGIWAPLYKLNGAIQLKGTIAGNTATGTGFWIKYPFEALKTRLYRAGFGTGDDEVALTTTGGIYTPPTLLQAYLNVVPGVNNANLLFSQAGVDLSATEPDLTISLGADASVTVPAAKTPQNPSNLKLKVNRKTGAVSGDFVLSDPNPLIPLSFNVRKVQFFGMIEPSTNRAYGYFILNQLPPTTGLPIPLNQTTLLSGSFKLQ